MYILVAVWYSNTTQRRKGYIMQARDIDIARIRAAAEAQKIARNAAAIRAVAGAK